MSDKGPVVTGRYDYTPYGNTIDHSGISTPLQYNGQYHDPTGLYYLRARYYDPAAAQFLTRDPIEALTGAAYNYVEGDPLNRSDPAGMSWYCPSWTWCPKIVGGVKKHWKGIVEVAGITLTVVAIGGSVVATGGLAGVVEISAATIDAASTTAAVASGTATVADLTLATSACKRDWRSLECAADVAAALASKGIGRVTETSLEKVLGEKVAHQIGVQQEANIQTILTAARKASGC